MWHIIESEGFNVRAVYSQNERDNALAVAYDMIAEEFDSDDELPQLDKAYSTLKETGVWDWGLYRLTIIEGKV